VALGGLRGEQLDVVARGVHRLGDQVERRQRIGRGRVLPLLVPFPPGRDLEQVVDRSQLAGVVLELRHGEHRRAQVLHVHLPTLARAVEVPRGLQRRAVRVDDRGLQGAAVVGDEQGAAVVEFVLGELGGLVGPGGLVGDEVLRERDVAGGTRLCGPAARLQRGDRERGPFGLLVAVAGDIAAQVDLAAVAESVQGHGLERQIVVPELGQGLAVADAPFLHGRRDLLLCGRLVFEGGGVQEPRADREVAEGRPHGRVEFRPDRVAILAGSRARIAGLCGVEAERIIRRGRCDVVVDGGGTAERQREDGRDRRDTRGGGGADGGEAPAAGAVAVADHRVDVERRLLRGGVGPGPPDRGAGLVLQVHVVSSPSARPGPGRGLR
jgi:hypothetical protein